MGSRPDSLERSVRTFEVAVENARLRVQVLQCWSLDFV